MSTCADPGIFVRGSRPDGQKTAWTTLFIFKSSTYFTVYREGLLVLFQRKLYFTKDPEGVQHFPGGSSLFQGGGVQMLISVKTHITCDFPRGGGGGGGGPDPPS